MSGRNKEIKNGRGTDLYIGDDSYISIGAGGENIAIRGAGKVFYFDTWRDLIGTITRGEEKKEMDITEKIKKLHELKEHCESMVDEKDANCIWKQDVEALQFFINLMSGKGENLLQLLKLMQENPELPVIPMVDGEIVSGDEYGYWMGEWGYATIDDYIISTKYAWAGQILFKSDDDVFDTLEKYLSRDEYENLPETEEECRPIYDALPWVKVIVVYITKPD